MSVSVPTAALRVGLALTDPTRSEDPYRPALCGWFVETGSSDTDFVRVTTSDSYACTVATVQFWDPECPRVLEGRFLLGLPHGNKLTKVKDLPSPLASPKNAPPFFRLYGNEPAVDDFPADKLVEALERKADGLAPSSIQPKYLAAPQAGFVAACRAYPVTAKNFPHRVAVNLVRSGPGFPTELAHRFSVGASPRLDVEVRTFIMPVRDEKVY